MAIAQNKTNIKITLSKNSLDLISKFADAMKMTKSEFIEEVCISFIADVVKQQQQRLAQDKAKQKKMKGKA
jgi:hypothetical protein